MTASSFLESGRFQQIRDEFYPTALHDGALRHRAYQERLRPYGHAATAAVEAVNRKIVVPLAKRFGGRFCCRVDRESLTKSPLSIDDKICRYLNKETVAGQPTVNETFLGNLRTRKADQDYFLRTFFGELPKVMNDLARFRIVTNFLVDAKGVRDAFGRSELRELGIEEEPDSIHDRMEEDRWDVGAGGHRAVHVYLKVPVGALKLQVEVLVMTLLQFGWDQKSHMFYEVARNGGGSDIAKRTRLVIPAVSDSLYLADVLFDELLEKAFPELEVPS